MSFDDIFEHKNKHHKYGHDHYQQHDYYQRSHSPRNHFDVADQLLSKLKANPKLKALLIIIAIVLIILVIGIVIILLPLIMKLVDFIIQNGIQGVLDAIWTGTNK